MSKEFEKVVDEFFNGFFTGSVSDYKKIKYNYLIRDNRHVVEVLLPGRKKEDIKVSFKGTMLLVMCEASDTEQKYISHQFSNHEKQKLSLEFGSNIAKVEPIYLNGILQVYIDFDKFNEEEFVEVK